MGNTQERSRIGVVQLRILLLGSKLKSIEKLLLWYSFVVFKKRLFVVGILYNRRAE
jgi:hypothetical protein